VKTFFLLFDYLFPEKKLFIDSVGLVLAFARFISCDGVLSVLADKTFVFKEERETPDDQ